MRAVAQQDHVAGVPVLVGDHREVCPGTAAGLVRPALQRSAAEVPGEQARQGGHRRFVVQDVETEPGPRLGTALDDDGARIRCVGVAVEPDPAGRGLLEGVREVTEGHRALQPDVHVAAGLLHGPEPVDPAAAEPASGAVGEHDQIVLGRDPVQVGHVPAELDPHPHGPCPVDEHVHEPLPAQAVARAAQVHRSGAAERDVLPGPREAGRLQGAGRVRIRRPHAGEEVVPGVAGPGHRDAPAIGPGVGAALGQGDPVAGIGPRGRDGEEEPARSAADTEDVHGRPPLPGAALRRASLARRSRSRPHG